MNPYGRPKKLVSVMLTELAAAGYERVGPTSIAGMIENMLGLPLERLREMTTAPDQPACVHIIAKAILSKKGFEAMESLLDRAHGKAKQQVDLTGVGATPTPTVTVVVQAVQPRPDGGA